MFETRFFERPADEQELEHLHKRHTDVLDNIDATADEAKEVASDFRAQLKTLHEQEQNLRRNLKSGTIPVEVEAKAIANLEAGVMEYFDRDGNLIPQLTHELSKADREQDALRKQLDMFQEPGDGHKVSSVTIATSTGQSVTLGEKLAHNDQQDSTDIFNTSPLGTLIGDVADLVTTPGVENLSDDQALTANGDPATSTGDEQPNEVASDQFDPADLDQLQADAEAAGTLPEKPEKKGKKSKPEPATV